MVTVYYRTLTSVAIQITHPTKLVTRTKRPSGQSGTGLRKVQHATKNTCFIHAPVVITNSQPLLPCVYLHTSLKWRGSAHQAHGNCSRKEGACNKTTTVKTALRPVYTERGVRPRTQPLRHSALPKFPPRSWSPLVNGFIQIAYTQSSANAAFAFLVAFVVVFLLCINRPLEVSCPWGMVLKAI